MAAMFWVDFADGTLVTVHSADAKSMKARDLRASYTKARNKARAKYAKTHAGDKGKVQRVRCVG